MTVVTRPFWPPLAATRWTLDASASSVEFSVRQFWGLSTVHGHSPSFRGELELGADGAGRAELCIEAASVATGNRRRDRHLRSADYFDCYWPPARALRRRRSRRGRARARHVVEPRRRVPNAGGALRPRVPSAGELRRWVIPSGAGSWAD